MGFDCDGPKSFTQEGHEFSGEVTRIHALRRKPEVLITFITCVIPQKYPS